MQSAELGVGAAPPLPRATHTWLPHGDHCGLCLSVDRQHALDSGANSQGSLLGSEGSIQGLGGCIRTKLCYDTHAGIGCHCGIWPQYPQIGKLSLWGVYALLCLNSSTFQLKDWYEWNTSARNGGWSPEWGCSLQLFPHTWQSSFQRTPRREGVWPPGYRASM